MEETIGATGQQLETFDGLGTALAGVFIGETLNTAHFDHDKDKFASYNGSAPATKGTGKHVRQVACPGQGESLVQPPPQERA